MRQWIGRWLVAALVLQAPHINAQTDPRTLPLADGAKIVKAGVFYLPGFDLANNQLTFGGTGVGVSEDGTRLYVSCHSTPGGTQIRGTFAILTIPPLGGTATVVQNCTGLSAAQLDGILGRPGGYFPTVGGIVERGGRLLVDGFLTYDAEGPNAPRRTFFSGGSLSTLTGPVEGTVRNGLVAGPLGRIPPEWQALLGGDTYATSVLSSIISRASYGPAFTAFNFSDAVRDGFPMTLLMACPHYIPGTLTQLDKCVSRWRSPQSLLYYNGPEQSGGAFFIAGTRSMGYIEREAKGPTCYGYATRDPAQHGLPYLDAVYCYSLSDPLSQKGPIGYPYAYVVKLVDAAEFINVKNGVRQPWDIDPYAVVELPANDDGAVIGYTGSGTFNDATGDYYLTRELFPVSATDRRAEVAVYRGFGAGTGPVPVDCEFTWGPWTRVQGSESACVGGSRTFLEERHITITRSPSNGGKACPASPETRQATEACAPPPPAPIEFDARCKVDTSTGVVACAGKVVPPGGGQ